MTSTRPCTFQFCNSFQNSNRIFPGGCIFLQTPVAYCPLSISAHAHAELLVLLLYLWAEALRVNLLLSQPWILLGMEEQIYLPRNAPSSRASGDNFYTFFPENSWGREKPVAVYFWKLQQEDWHYKFLFVLLHGENLTSYSPNLHPRWTLRFTTVWDTPGELKLAGCNLVLPSRKENNPLFVSTYLSPNKELSQSTNQKVLP